MAKLPPLILKDFRMGRYSRSSVADSLCPVNSVAECLNVDFDRILGAITVRDGMVVLGPKVATGHTIVDAAVMTGTANQTPTPAGGIIFSTGTFQKLVAAVTILTAGTWTNTIYWGVGMTHAYTLSNYSVSGTLAPTDAHKTRFAQLNGRLFAVTAGVPMQESADANTWSQDGNCIPSTINPSLVFRFQGRLVAAGDPAYPSRVWFSSVVNLRGTPFITWNLDSVIGDWIDINPDDGGKLVGFAETSTFLLIFKDTGMYRMSLLDKSVTPDNIYNIGAISQECIATCQGVVYFYTGAEIMQTVGDYPQSVSRAGLGGVVLYDSKYVAMGSDNNHVYVAVAYGSNCFKYSVRDQSWTQHGYSQYPIGIFVSGVIYPASLYTDTTKISDGFAKDGNNLYVICSSVDGVRPMSIFWMHLEAQGLYGDGAYINTAGSLVAGYDIAISVTTQIIDMGYDATYKIISDKVIAIGAGCGPLTLDMSVDELTFVHIATALPTTVSICPAIVPLGGHRFQFRWTGTVSYASAVRIDGLEIHDITDSGINDG